MSVLGLKYIIAWCVCLNPERIVLISDRLIRMYTKTTQKKTAGQGAIERTRRAGAQTRAFGRSSASPTAVRMNVAGSSAASVAPRLRQCRRMRRERAQHRGQWQAQCLRQRLQSWLR